MEYKPVEQKIVKKSGCNLTLMIFGLDSIQHGRIRVSILRWPWQVWWSLRSSVYCYGIIAPCWI